MRPEVLLPAWTRLAAARPLRSRIPPRRDGARALSSTPGGPPLQKKKPDLPPVFLVHGFRVLTKDTVDETSLSSMDAALVRRGYQNVHRFDYPSREDSLQNHAASLADFISRQLSPPEAAGAGGRGQLGPFGVVTHSFGGVVARAALNLLQVHPDT
ncbi:hypothetical protein T484DRAFT_2561808 [Baffinella frigidus]|nr:hypothetical protein T484DRAFT_2561808 [Cryptophyta sp. CCMP2293]